jgi:hypothetical protein
MTASCITAECLSMEFTKSAILVVQNVLVWGTIGRTLQLLREVMSLSLHIFFMTLRQPNRHKELGPRRPFVCVFCLLKKVKKCRSICASQYGGQSIHWTDISSVINSRAADRFVSVSDMIDRTELENDG